MDRESTTALDWATAPEKFRAAFDRKDAEIARLRRLVRGTEALHRELCLTRALGADALDSVTGRSFATAYTGELSTEAVKSAWGMFMAEAVANLAENRSLHELADAIETSDAPTPDELAEQNARRALHGMETAR